VTSREFIRRLERALERIHLENQHIAEILEEVRSYLAESGEDPVEAFGQPENYAFNRTGANPDDYRPSVLARILAVYLWMIALSTIISAVWPAGRSTSFALWNLVLAILLVTGGTVLWSRNRPVGPTRVALSLSMLTTGQRVALIGVLISVIVAVWYTLLPYQVDNLDCGYAWAAISKDNGACARAAADRVRIATVSGGAATVAGIGAAALLAGRRGRTRALPTAHDRRTG